MKLPIQYETAMRSLLGEEYNAYLETFAWPFIPSIRINTAKISPEKFLELSGWDLEKVPWTENGFYVKDVDISHHPYYYAGLYYIQEASAMVPASRIPIRPGDRVADLCAAPGGKSTELASRIGKDGFLLANDISSARAKALQKNLEQEGFSNFSVCAEDPSKLAKLYPESFDAILVDAPCSGEGMFHRKPEMVKDWEEKGPVFYAEIQRRILTSAVSMLKKGGSLLFSTCTFSVEENEKNVLWMEENLGMEVIPALGSPEFSEGVMVDGHRELKNCIRIFPHKTRGEGHFVAVLRKKGEEKEKKKIKKSASKAVSEECLAFLSKFPKEHFLRKMDLRQIGEQIYGLNDKNEIRSSVRYLRTGLLIGTEKKKRFEPSQALAMTLEATDFPSVISLPASDDRVIRYLKGETIDVDADVKNGWVLICVDHYPLGWGKYTNGTIKNKYYPGWRML